MPKFMVRTTVETYWEDEIEAVSEDEAHDIAKQIVYDHLYDEPGDVILSTATVYSQ